MADTDTTNPRAQCLYAEWPSGKLDRRSTEVLEIERIVRQEHKAKWDARIADAERSGER